jgi:peptide/nickel transport system substrate-binding protein
MSRWIAPRRCAVIRGMVGLICLAMLLSACAAPLQIFGQSQPTPTSIYAPTEVPYQTATPVPTLPVPSTYKQSPNLDVLVRDSQLPSVAQRLPEHPKVVRPVERVGQYGGTWRMVIQATADTAQFIRTVAYEPLVRWSSDWSGIEPNLVESYSFNSNRTEFTFILRRGLHWSDGELFTTRDIRFWYEDILLNPQLTPSIPNWLVTRNEVVKFEFVDELTFKVHFLTPNGLFLEQLATPDALMITAFPAHYAQKFHQKYLTPEDLSSQLQRGGFASWTEMFSKTVGIHPLDEANFTDPDRPRLTAWISRNAYNPGAGTVIWSRNPYYWKVDPEGNQLPYINTVYFKIIHNTEDVINLTLDNQVDMQNLGALGIDVAAMLQGETSSSQPAAQYKTFKLLQSQNNVMAIHLNLTHPNRVKREMFQKKDFRIGLSYAINRQEILDLLFNGGGKPWQAAPPEGSPFYDPLMATQYTNFNRDEADRYLDKAGFQKDQLGHRLGPDGQPISFTVEVLENEPLQIAMLNMISRYLADVGINMQPKIDPLPVFMAIVQANKHDAAVWSGGGIYFSDVLLRPSDYVANSADAYWAVGWANWYTNRVSGGGEQPDEPALLGLGMYDRILAAQSPKEQIRLMKSTLQIARENFWNIGIALGPDRYGVIRENFHNVPAEMPAAWIYPDPAPTNPEQYFINP